ncbi:hypothetical protein, partial [Zoogloea oleivorans]|uniref:hypothetical protein n=1 Tax=Zoogloea oleivorans TaxID=1552750 RepID=UPI001CA35CE5
MNKTGLFVIVPIALSIAACGKLPECADSATQELVRDVFFGRENNEKVDMGDLKDLKANFSVKIDTIQTISQSEKPPKYTCKATITVKPSEEYVKFLTKISNRIKNDEGQKIKDEFFAGLDSSDLTFQEKMGLVQNLYFTVGTPMTYGVDLSAYASEVTYTSSFANQDGKEHHIVSARFANPLPVGGFVFTKIALEKGAELIKKNPTNAAGKTEAKPASAQHEPAPEIAPEAAPAPAPAP